LQIACYLDHRRKAWVPALKREIAVARGAVFFVTLNEGYEYVGTNPIDEALRDRMTYAVRMSYVPKKVEKAILTRRTGVDEETAEKLAEFARTVRRNPKMGVPVSTRQLLGAASLVAEGMALQDAVLFSVVNGMGEDVDYGVLIDPARAGKPKDKPRIERMVPYIRGSFWAGRHFSSLEEINREMLQWCLKVAGQRIHGTIRQRPLEVFSAVEQAALRPLPAEPFEIATWGKTKVGWDCYFYAAGAGYTMPYICAGKEVTVRLTPKLVQAYVGYELVKTHLRVPKGRRATDWDDFPPEKAAFFRRTPDWCRQQAARVGEEVGKTVESLLEDHLLYHLRQTTAS
jgi:hypothetical protein